MNRLNIKVGNNVTLSTIIYGSLPVDFILVHGLASNALLWEGVANFLLEQGYSSVAVDLRGHGLSSKPLTDYSYDRISMDLLQVAKHVVQPDVPAVLLGQSWGASVVVEFAIRHPEYVESLVLVDGAYSDLKANFGSWEECLERLRPPDFSSTTLSQARLYMEGAHAKWSKSAIDATLANLEELGDRTIRARLSLANHLAILHELYQFTPRESIQQINMPVRILVAKTYATLTPTVRNEIDRLRAIPAVEFDFFNDASHDLHAESPEMVGKIAMDEYEKRRVLD